MKMPRLLRALGACLVAMAVPTKLDTDLVEPGHVMKSFEIEPHMPNTKRIKLDPKIIKPWPEVNPREDYNPADMDLLFASIDEGGLIEPIKVNLRRDPVGEGAAPLEYYHLIDGQGRLSQVLALGWDSVDVELYYDISVATALDIVSSMCLQRPFNVVEQCRHMARLYEAGRNRSYIARTMGISESTVDKRLLIDGLPDEVKDMMIRETNALPIHQAMLLVPLTPEQAEDMAYDIAPEKGRVMTETEARDWVKRQVRPPCPPAMPGSVFGGQATTDNETPPQEGSGPTTDGDDSTHPTSEPDPSVAGLPAPIKQPGKGSAKDPNLVGLRRELPGVMRVEGVFNISKAGVRIDQAQISCEAGVCDLSWGQPSLVLDLGPEDIKMFQEFVKAEAESLADNDAGAPEVIDLSVGDKVSLASFNVGVSCQDQAKDPCVIEKVNPPKDSGLPVSYAVLDKRKYSFSCYRHQMEPWDRAQGRS